MSARIAIVDQKIEIGSYRISEEVAFVSVCLALAIFIRYLLIPGNTVINGDGIYYTILGDRFVSGDFAGGISAYWSPLYSILTGFSSLVLQDPEFGGRLVSLAAGSLLIVPAYVLFRNLFCRVVANFGTILLVLNPSLIKASGWVMTESLYTLIFTTFALFAWLALRNGDLRVFFATGLLLGAAFLTKPESVGFLGLIILLSIAKSAWAHIGLRKSIINCLVLIAGFAVFFLPYFIFLHQKTGEWTISQKVTINLPAADYQGELLELGNNSKILMKDRIWGDDYETKYSPVIFETLREANTSDLASLKERLGVLGSRSLILFKKQLRDYIPGLLTLPMVLIAIIGFFTKPWTRTRLAKEVYLILLVLCTLIGYAVSTVELRYLFPIIPILIVWVARGIVEFSEWALKSVSNLVEPAKKFTPVYFQVFTLFLILISLTPRFQDTFAASGIQQIPFEEKNAGVWIKNHSATATPVVMSAHITVAYYAGAKHLYIPDAEPSAIVDYAKLTDVDYLVLSKRRMRDDPSLLDESASLLKDFTLVHVNRDYLNFEVFVYERNR